MIFEFECSDCLTEFAAGEDVCVCCGADLTVLVDSAEEGEHDGQPDEMQEWHDFDPDC